MKRFPKIMIAVFFIWILSSAFLFTFPLLQAQPLGLEDFMVWLTAGGSVIAVSWICERWAWFQAQPSERKKWLQYGLSTLIGIVALLVQTYVPASVITALTPYFAVIVGVFSMVFLNQAAHTLDPLRTRGSHK